jgi:hypothetical protein
MRQSRLSLLIAGVFFLFVVADCAISTNAQTASTGAVVGTVNDPGGAVVPDATVALQNRATNSQVTQQTNAAGQYTFPNVEPGDYRITVKKAGFRTASVESLTVAVAKSYTLDIKLEIGQVSETVTVTTEARAELQTTDAVMGDVLGGTSLTHLPTLQRDSRELLTLQPASTPYETSNGGGFGDAGGTVAGARSDQNAFNLDGIDITDNVIAGGGNQVPIVPIGVDGIEEFRVGLTNNNASFGRASGGQINVISKGGTNSFHGAAYWYHQNSALNANAWDNNSHSIARQPQHDNRAGAAFGGPLKKNKTFFFGNYEIRRFPQAIQITRIMPSDTLRQGIITVGGVKYNLATSNACGASGNLPCDPRGIGISPTIKDLWGMMPKGNDPTVLGADGVNTIGLRTSIPALLKDDSVAFRLDHNFTDKVKFFGHYLYHRDLTPNANGTTGQIDLRSGTAVNPSDSNLRGDGFTSGLEWQVSNNLVNSLRVGWIRSRQDFVVIRPRDSAAELNLPGTDSPLGPVALAPGLGATGFIDTIIDVDTQRARHQAIYDSNKQYADTLSWIKGKHTIVTGGDIRWLPTIHDRDDKVIGSVNSLVATLDADVSGSLTIPAADRPPGLSTSDALKWDRFYAASLGLIDTVGILAVRDGNLQPKPLGASLVARTTLRSYNFFGQDTWRIKPSFTLTYGLAYGWQTTPHELHNQQTLIANHDNGDQILNAFDYLNQKEQAALNGNIFNPTLSYVPISKSGRSDVFSVDYGDWAPRVSAAWNPSLRSGFLGRMFGDRKTVVRGGYGIAYDRVNTVQSVIIPMLGVGFAQTINNNTPLCNANGTSIQGCNASVPLSTNAGLASFRVGVDGSIPTPPAPTAVQSPVVPSSPLGEILSFQNDPQFQVGRSHSVDFTIQRSLPGQMIFEAGYIGRFARHLPNSVNFNSAPYMFKDKASGQSFAQAFDTVATALRNGQAPPTEPWFENQLPGFGVGCGPIDPKTMKPTNISSTACFATGNSTDVLDGNISNLFLTMDFIRQFGLGLQPYTNTQVLDLFTRTSRDKSNYHALVLTLRNNSWRGLFFDFNYTFSKSLDTVGAVQNDARYYSSSYNTHLDYGPSFFDRPHVFNAVFDYELPFGKGRFHNNHAFINKITGGWYAAGIFRRSSGVPELVTISGQPFGGGIIFATPSGALPTVPADELGGGSIHGGVNGSTVNTPQGPQRVGTSGCQTNCTDAQGNPIPPPGTGLNYFANPAAAFLKFRPTLLATDTNDGRDSPVRGLPFWNLDTRLGKTTNISERVKIEFSADFFNLFNHANFLDPSFDLTNPAVFGVINTQLIPADRISGARWIQLGFRIDF